MERKGKLYLPDGTELKPRVEKMGDEPAVPMKGIVPDMRVLEDRVLQGEVDGASKGEGLARGREYMEIVEGTKTTVQAQKPLRERMKEERGRPKRRKCGKS